MQTNSKYFGVFGTLPKRHGKPTAIVIHHTCTRSPEKTRSALLHKKCSTHFEVDVDGTVYRYADEKLVASHCGSANIHTIGIDVTHMENAPFPQVQVDAVKELVTELCIKWNIPQIVHLKLEGIYPHCAVGNTDCPNGFPMEQLGELITTGRDEVSLALEMIDIAIVNDRTSALVEGMMERGKLVEEINRWKH